MRRFNKDGRWIVPFSEWGKAKSKKEDKSRYIISKAYCPNGCNVIDSNYQINGFSGLRIKFKRSRAEGEFVISAIEGDFDKIVISGELKEGAKDELYCPHCGVMFEKLVNCDCVADADMVVIGLTPKLDFNNAISFCNVTGCHKGAFTKSGDILRHIRLKYSF